MDTNLLSNIHKLFSERIDIFSSVEFNKVNADHQVVFRRTFLQHSLSHTF